jgi:hypothetical protein
MQRFFLLAALPGLLVFAGLTLAGGDQTKRQPVPDKKALTKAVELVNDIFKDEIAKAKDPDKARALAVYLVGQGDESSDDPAARFVLYRQARDLAVFAGDAALTLNTIDKMAQYFQVSGLDLKAEALGKLVDKVAVKDPSKALTELTLSLINEALDADNYDAATELGKVAAAAAKNSQVVALVTAVGKRNADVQAAKEKFSVLQPFVDRLKKDPNDAEANLKMGEYFGLFKGKWDRAMPYLAKSKAEPLAGLAKQDVTGPKEAADQAKLADAWWEYAAGQKDPQQARLQERAAYWYDKAIVGLGGLSRTKAQKRIDVVAARNQGTQTPVEGPIGFIKSLEGHSSEIRALAISADGRFGLSGSVDNSMRLWDLTTFKEIQSFKGHTKQVWGVAFVPGGKHVLSASWDATVKMWDVTTGKDVKTFNHPVDVNGVFVSRDGKWMLTCCDDKHMRLWDLVKYEEVKKYSPHTNFCYCGAFSPSGQYVASGGADKRAMVFELNTGKVVREVEQNNAIYVVAFSPDGKYLFTCGDNAVHMWNIETGKEEKRFESPTGYINSMALSADGKRLLTGGEDKVVRVWDVTTGKVVKDFPGHTTTISAVAMTADGRRALTGQTDGGIRYWGLPAR